MGEFFIPGQLDPAMTDLLTQQLVAEEKKRLKGLGKESEQNTVRKVSEQGSTKKGLFRKLLGRGNK